MAAAAPASSRSWSTATPASEAAFSRANRWASLNVDGTEMTAPLIDFPRKSSADWTSDLIKIVATSDTLRIRSTRTGSERGVGAWEAAGVAYAEVGKGVGAG